MVDRMEIQEIIKEAQARGASDIHLASGAQVMFRIDGKLVRMSDEAVMPRVPEKMLQLMLNDTQREELKQTGELDFAYSSDVFRVRVSAFLQRGTYAMTIRILSQPIPKPEELGLPKPLINLTKRDHGLVLVTGTSGSGITTTLASLIHRIAENQDKSIITLESPIEYLHEHGRSVVYQREIGCDSQSYADALRAALHQTPDVIMVGEMRDAETISAVLTAAETGHLVFAALHTNSAMAALDYMTDMFLPHQQPQLRARLAHTLNGIAAQQLLPKQNAGGRVAAFEVMLTNAVIANLITEGKTYQLPSTIQNCHKEGMQTMDDAIYELYMKSYIDSATAISYAQDAEEMQRKVQFF